MSLDDFFTGYQQTALKPDEILTEIQIPLPLPRTGSAYHKEAVRRSDPPIISVGTMLRLEEQGAVAQTRILLQAVGVTPLRALKAEKVLTGEKIGEKELDEAARLAASAAQPISDIYGTADYKREMIRVITRRVVAEAARQATKSSKRGQTR